ncbi:MAG: tetratricopeptide repeat protein, partial [Bacteroidota bacterium]
FENDLENDPQLSEQLEEQKDILMGVQAFQQRQLKEDLKAMHSELIPSQAKPKLRTLNIYRLTAIAAVFAGIAFALGWMLQSQSKNHEQLFADFYQPYQLKIGQRGSAPEQQTADLLRQYSDKQYEAALASAESILAQEPNNSVWLLAAGNCLMELDRPEEAIARFDQIINRNEPFYLQQAIWYKALALLQFGQEEAAAAQLKTLANNPNADHHQEAVELLKAIQ